jgi:WD40 repeat protein
MLKAKTCVVVAFLGLSGWLVVRGLAAEEPAPARADRPDAAEKAKPASDAFGDPLPAYARLRLGTIRFRQGSPITTLRYLADGKTLVSAGTDQVIRFWEASTGRELYRFGTPLANTTNAALAPVIGLPAPDDVGDVVYPGMRALSPDGKRVATLEGDQTIKLWDPATGKEIGQLGKPLTNSASRQPPVFSEDGKSLAAVEYDGLGGMAIQVFDIATGKETRLTGPEPKDEGQPGFQLQSLALAPDSKTVIALGNENGVANKLRLWHIATGKAVEVQDSTNLNPVMLNQPVALGVAGVNQALFFTPGGKQFAMIVTTTNQESGANGFNVRLWDAATGKKLRDIGGHAEMISGVHFAPDGASVALVTNNQSVKVHDLTTGKEKYALAAAVNTAVMSVLFAPDSRTLAVANADHTIQLYDAAKGELRHDLKGSENRLGVTGYSLVLAFSTDSKTLAAGGSSVIRLWDAATGKEIHPVRAGHEGNLNALVVAANGKLVATAGVDNSVRLWDPASGKELRHITGPSVDGIALINAFGMVPPSDVRVAFSNDSRYLGIGWTDGSIDLWDVQTGKRVHQLKAHQLPIVSLAFAPNGKMLASGALDGRALWWDVATGKMLRVIAGRPLAEDGPELPPGAVTGFDASLIAMAPDGRTLAVASQDIGGYAIGLYETATFQLRRKLRLKPEAAPNAQLALLVGGNAVNPFMSAGLPGPSALRFTPDGKGLLWTSGMTTRLVDVAKGKEIRRFGGQDDTVNGIAMSPDGKLLAGASGDGTVQFWDVASGTVLGALTGHRGPVSSVAFTPDGQAVLTGGADTTALLWDVPRFLEDTRLAPKDLVDERLGALWKTLGSENSQEAFEALHQIQAAPKQAIALLRACIKPAPPANTERISRLVADLESDRFEVRKLATLSLEKLGELSESALRKRLADSPPLEVRQRIEHLLDKLAGPITDPERLRAHRGLEILEQIATPEAKAVLQALARGAPEARLTQEAKEALERLK